VEDRSADKNGWLLEDPDGLTVGGPCVLPATFDALLGD